MTGNTKFSCMKRIEIGNNCLISWGGYFLDSDFHKIYCNDVLINKNQEIIIGNHVWICMNVSILKGASIPNNCVIGAGSIVTTKLHNESSIYINNKAIKTNIEWKR